MVAIQDIQALGYTIGIAHGAVSVEEDALLAAQRESAPEVVTQRVAILTRETLDDVAAAGRLPETNEERQILASEIANAALDMVITHTSEKVAFHQRALEAAKAMPTVWHVDQTVDVDGGTQRVVSTYVACKEDGTGWDAESEAILDALAHQPSYDERVFQAQNPAAMEAAQALQSAGKDVIREAGVESFIIDGETLDAAGVVALADETSSGG